MVVFFNIRKRSSSQMSKFQLNFFFILINFFILLVIIVIIPLNLKTNTQRHAKLEYFYSYMSYNIWNLIQKQNKIKTDFQIIQSKMENNKENNRSMSLQTIPNVIRTYYHNKHDYMDISDISGTRSRNIQKPLRPREVFYNRNEDIQKSKPNILIPKTVNKPDRQLEVDDIKGTRTRLDKLYTCRSTNPLNPIYQLPQVEYTSYPAPKYLKDSMQIDDIQGTRMKQTFILKLEQEGKYLKKDTSPLQTKIIKQPKKNNFLFQVSDINLKKNKIIPNRNPLEPIYHHPVSVQGRFCQEIGPIQGSKPTILKSVNTPFSFNLTVFDIPGAVAKQNKFSTRKNQIIPQAKVGSLKHGISTNRQTNPLQPNYQYIGCSEQSNYSYSKPKTSVQKFDAFLIK